VSGQVLGDYMRQNLFAPLGMDSTSFKIAPSQRARLAAIHARGPDGVSAGIARSMFTWFFTDRPVTDYESAKRADTARFKRFFHAMLERGIYLPPSQFEAAFVSTAHSDADIECTVNAARDLFAG
jgi:glutamate-1-semialdehyde 2,1-aminomutase